jgi:hypothetical protein
LYICTIQLNICEETCYNRSRSPDRSVYATEEHGLNGTQKPISVRYSAMTKVRQKRGKSVHRSDVTLKVLGFLKIASATFWIEDNDGKTSVQIKVHVQRVGIVRGTSIQS